MGLLKLMGLWLPQNRLAEVAREIADRSQREVTQLVSGQTAGMSAAEQRGYIRARSASVIHREVDLAMHWERHLRAVDRPTLVQLATEAVVTAVASTPRTRRQRKVA